MRKEMTAVVVSIMALFVLVSCDCQLEKSAFSGGDCRTVIDSYGREVVVASEPKSVAVYGRGAARMVVYAGASSKLIGVSDMDKEASPWMPYALANEDFFASLPSVGSGGSKDVAYDEILVELHPDLIISTYGNDENQLLQDKVGIPVVGVVCQNMIFEQQLYDSIALIGDILGTSDYAENVIEGIKAFERDLRARIEDISADEQISAYVGGVNYLGPKSLDGTFSEYEPFDVVFVKNVVDDVSETAGAININIEMLGEWDPDLIFVNPLNISMLRDAYKENLEYLETIEAIDQNRVYAQPAFNYNGTNVELGIINAYYVGKIAYPDRFSDVDIPKKADEVFIAMVGLPMYDQMEKAGMALCEVDIKR